MSIRILSLDTETTGVGTSDQIMQLAYIDVPNEISTLIKDFTEIGHGRNLLHLPKYAEYFRPDVPCHPEAFKVHGITPEMVADCLPSEHAVLPSNCTHMIAHNAPFDYRMLGKPDVKVICTVSLAKKIEKIRGEKFPCENYQLFTMFSAFYPELRDNFVKIRHDALTDCYMSTLLLVALLKHFPFIKTIDGVYEYFFAEDVAKKKAKEERAKLKQEGK